MKKYVLAACIVLMCSVANAGELGFGVNWGFKLGYTPGPLDIQRVAHRQEMARQRSAQAHERSMARYGRAPVGRSAPKVYYYRAPAQRYYFFTPRHN